jgi:hypothetical protein
MSISHIQFRDHLVTFIPELSDISDLGLWPGEDANNFIHYHWVVFRSYTDSNSIGKEIGVDPEIILATSHGRRTIDVLKIYEPKLANWDCT